MFWYVPVKIGIPPILAELFWAPLAWFWIAKLLPEETWEAAATAEAASLEAAANYAAVGSGIYFHFINYYF